jgi:hypothetical protein
MVTAEMTEFIPGAGPPPHKIPSLTPTSFQQQGDHHKRAAPGPWGHRGLLADPLHRTERQKAVGVTASDVMSRPPVTIGAVDLVSHAAHVMYDRKVSCLLDKVILRSFSYPAAE